MVLLIVSASGATAQSHEEGSSVRLPHLGLRPGHYLQLTIDKISLKTPRDTVSHVSIFDLSCELAPL